MNQINHFILSLDIPISIFHKCSVMFHLVPYHVIGPSERLPEAGKKGITFKEIIYIMYTKILIKMSFEVRNCWMMKIKLDGRTTHDYS